MLILLLILALSAGAVVGSVHLAARDGYRRVPIDRSRLP